MLYYEMTKTFPIQILDLVLDWYSTWQVELNIDKCKHLRVCCRALSCPEYIISSIILECMPLYKYLGIHKVSVLSWYVHIEHINANHVLGYIRCNFLLVCLDLKLALHKTLIRPKLEHATPV